MIEITLCNPPPRAGTCNLLWIEKPKQVFFVLLAEGGSNAHVLDDGAGDAGRKALRCVVAAGTILLEDQAAFVVMLLQRLRSGMSLTFLRGQGFDVGRPLRECGRRQDSENREKIL